MYSLRVLLVALAGSAFVAAFPLQENTLQARDCPAGYQVCGTCSGNTCNIPPSPQPCKIGSCTADGNMCGVKQDAVVASCT